MPNFQDGKIYKIVCSENDLIYVGSTTNKYLSQRLVAHRDTYSAWKRDNNKSYCSSNEILKSENYTIVLLELFPCNSKDALCAKEQEWIDKLNSVCVNKRKAATGIKADNKLDYAKQYRNENKEIIEEKKKEYYEENKKSILIKTKQYRHENKEIISEKNRVRYHENREAMIIQMKQYRELNTEKIKH